MFLGRVSLKFKDGDLCGRPMIRKSEFVWMENYFDSVLNVTTLSLLSKMAPKRI